MDIPLPDFREFHDAILAHDRKPLYWTFLWPWLESHPAEREWLQAFASRRGDPIPPATHEELWELYALSRIHQRLLLRFQQGRADGTDFQGPEISLQEYRDFSQALGMTAIDDATFSPFLHEIVEVEQADRDDAPAEIVDTLWPCLMLGNMVFSRAGVRVSAGRKVLSKEVAERSTLYWAYWRKNRPYQDQSRGWGHNSQWRTSFRRDYRIDHRFHYNVDGKFDLTAADYVPQWEDEGLTREMRIELVTHRCFVVTTLPHNDLYPYVERFSEIIPR